MDSSWEVVAGLSAGITVSTTRLFSGVLSVLFGSRSRPPILLIRDSTTITPIAIGIHFFDFFCFSPFSIDTIYYVFYNKLIQGGEFYGNWR
nr:MAG TPA: hypothetical protein [Caudoviricetes sp.]